MKKKAPWLAALVLLLAVPLLLVWNYYNAKLDRIQYDDGSRPIDASVSLPAGELDVSGLPEAPAATPAPLLESEIYQDDDVVNLLLLGTDERTDQFSDNARADAILVLSLDTDAHTARLVSIERGIGVPVPGRPDDWLTHTFRYGGAALTMQTVRDCFRLDVQNYVRINFHMFEKAIDTIGGVDIPLTPAEAECIERYRVNYSSYHHLQPVQAGPNHLDGATALFYARIREIDSDWKRIERQRTVIQAAVDRVKGLSLSELNRLADTVLPMVQTDLEKSQITALLLEVPGFLAQGVELEQMTIPAEGTAWSRVGTDGRSLIGVDFEANARIMREFFYEIIE